MDGKAGLMEHSDLPAKVRLRCAAVDLAPPGPVDVLDCFAGQGILWRLVQDRQPTRAIRVTAVEADPSAARPGVIVADSRDVLASPGLGVFAVVDLDAWGWPYDHLDVLTTRIVDGYQPPAAVTVTHPAPSPRRRLPAAVAAAGGWDAWTTARGWRTARTLRARTGGMRYELLTWQGTP